MELSRRCLVGELSSELFFEPTGLCKSAYNCAYNSPQIYSNNSLEIYFLGQV